MGNQLISFRLNPEIVSAIAQRYPGLSPSEGAKALLVETLGLSASPMPSKPGLEDIYERLQALEARVFTHVDTPDDTPVSTPNDTLMTLDDTLQTPELSSNDTDDTLLTPDDTREIIAGLLAKNPEIKSLRGIVTLLRKENIKIPGKSGIETIPTNQNIKPYLPQIWQK